MAFNDNDDNDKSSDMESQSSYFDAGIPYADGTVSCKYRKFKLTYHLMLNQTILWNYIAA